MVSQRAAHSDKGVLCETLFCYVTCPEWGVPRIIARLCAMCKMISRKNGTFPHFKELRTQKGPNEPFVEDK